MEREKAYFITSDTVISMLVEQPNLCACMKINPIESDT